MKKHIALLLCIIFSALSLHLSAPLLVIATETILNGGFENLNLSGHAVNWTYNTSVVSVVEANQNKYLQIATSEPNDVINNAYSYQLIMNVAPGAEYTVQALINSSNLGGRGICFKYEFYDINSISAGHGLGEDASDPFSPTNGQWQQVSHTFTTPENCVSVALYLRLYGTGTACFDNISCIMTKEPDRLFLTTDSYFNYTDWETGVATAALNPYYTNPVGCSVDFKLKDGSTEIDEQLSTSISSGIAVDYEYDLDLLSVIGKEYTVEATLKNSLNEVVMTKTVPVYRYNRPSALREDGVYMKNGEPFYPVIATAVTQEADYPICKGMGMNVVNGYLWALEDELEWAENNGLMVLALLYQNMKPAGHPDNATAVSQAVTAFKNHPALFAWAIMDEPFANNCDPADLLNSYKLVRDIDPVHPVYAVEALTTDYEQAGKYVDILGIDPYPGGNYAPETHVSDMTEAAVAAVEGKKPVYALMQAFDWGSYFPTGDEIRNMAYQAIYSGAKGIGYYRYTDAYNGYNLDETAIGDVITTLHKKEIGEVFSHFVNKEGTVLGENKGNNVWWRTWKKADSIYTLVLNRGDTSQSQSISLPYGTNVQVLGDGTAGDASIANSTLYVDVVSSGAILCKIDLNLVKNGGFEAESSSGIPYWILIGGTFGTNFSISNDSLHNGGGSLETIKGTGNLIALQTVTSNFTAGDIYRIDAWVNNADSTSGIYIKYEFHNATTIGTGTKIGNTNIAAAASAESGWKKYSNSVVIPEGCAMVAVYLCNYSPTSGTTVYFDDVSLKRGEILLNGGFESPYNNTVPDWSLIGGTFGTNFSVSTDNVHSGNNSIKTIKGSGNLIAMQDPISDFTAGDIYQIDAWVNNVDSTSGIYIKYEFHNATTIGAGTKIGNTNIAAVASAESGWIKYSNSIVIPEGCIMVAVYLCNYSPTSGAIVYFDDVSLVRG